MHFNNIKHIFIIALFVLLWQNAFSQCLDFNKQVEPDDFYERSYFKKIFDQPDDYINFNSVNNLYKEANKLGVQSNEAQREAQKLEREAERETKNWKQKRAYSKAQREEEKVLDLRVKAYDFRCQGNTVLINFFIQKMDEVRYRNTNIDAREARFYEKKAKDFDKQASGLIQRAERAPSQRDRLDYLIEADSIQKRAIGKLEQAFAVYMGDSPRKREQLIQDMKKQQAQQDSMQNLFEVQIDALLAQNVEDKKWVNEINRLSEKNKKLKQEKVRLEEENERLREENDRLQKQDYNKHKNKIRSNQTIISRNNKTIIRNRREIASLEKRIVAELQVKIEESQQRLNEQFLSLSDLMSRRDPAAQNTTEYRAVEKKRSAILGKYADARANIDTAYFINKCPQNRLKVYVLLLQASKLRAQAVEDQKNMENDYPTIFLSEKQNIPLYTTETEGVGTTDKTKKKKRRYRSSRKSQSTSQTRRAKELGLHFKVQIFSTTTTNIPSNAAYKGLAPISSEKDGNMLAHLYGFYRDITSAQAAKQRARAKGFSDAYVVAYHKGQRIQLAQAKEMLEKGYAIYPQRNSSPGTGISFQNVYNNRQNANEKVKAKDIRNIPGLVYTVQVASVNKPATAGELKNLAPVYLYRSSSGKLKYSIGLYSSESKAAGERNRITASGIPGAFVVAYYNGLPISIQDAREKAKDIKPTGSNIQYKKLIDHGQAGANLLYYVQVGAFMGGADSQTEAQFNTLAAGKPVSKNVNSHGLTVYRIGAFTDYSKALSVQQQAVRQGFSDSFILTQKNR